MQKSKIVVGVVLLMLFAGNVFLGVQLFLAHREIQKIKQDQHLNASVLNFANIFIAKVLKAQGEISFEDRLKIENAVRDTQDKEIYDQWQKFVGAQTTQEGQEDVKNLLQLMVNKLN